MILDLIALYAGSGRSGVYRGGAFVGERRQPEALVRRVTDIIAEISAASQEQSQGIDQVNRARAARQPLSSSSSAGSGANKTGASSGA